MELETYIKLHGNRFTLALNNSGQHNGVIVPWNIKLCQAMGVALGHCCDEMKDPNGQRCGRVYNTMYHRAVGSIKITA